MKVYVNGGFRTVNKKDYERELKEKKYWSDYTNRKLSAPKGYYGISYGKSGKESYTMKQYREVSPKGTYIYKRGAGMTVWFKKQN